MNKLMTQTLDPWVPLTPPSLLETFPSLPQHPLPLSLPTHAEIPRISSLNPPPPTSTEAPRPIDSFGGRRAECTRTVPVERHVRRRRQRPTPNSQSTEHKQPRGVAQNAPATRPAPLRGAYVGHTRCHRMGARRAGDTYRARGETGGAEEGCLRLEKRH